MEPLRLYLAPTPAAANLSRRALSAWLQELGAGDAAIGDAEVVISELVTNGVIHAPGDDIAITAYDDSRGITLDVTTRLPPLGSLVAQRAYPDEHGRGLAIVAALVDEIIITDDHTSHRVRCRLASL
ncbi:MAG: hypothetical protein NVS3B21_29830 [Acidimicrobiales bacterium]